MCAEENEGRENSSHGFDYISLVRKCFAFDFCHFILTLQIVY